MLVTTDADAAVAAVQKGACVGVGGSVNAGHPMALVRALIRRRLTDLVIVGLTSGLDVDLLVASGSVGALSAAYVGAEDVLGLPPAIRWMAETGALDIWESEEGVHLASLRARAQRQPFVVWTGALGTAVADSHPLVEQAVDERTGTHYLKVRPMEVDVALLWADAADADGNVLLWGTDFGDEALLHAADHRIIQVERIVNTSVLAREPDRVAPWAADVVVHAPLSTHPFGSSRMAVDEDWLRSYGDTVTAARTAGDPDALARFVDLWARDLPDEVAYLEKVGMRRLLDLLR